MGKSKSAVRNDLINWSVTVGSRTISGKAYSIAEAEGVSQHAEDELTGKNKQVKTPTTPGTDKLTK